MREKRFDEKIEKIAAMVEEHLFCCKTKMKEKRPHIHSPKYSDPYLMTPYIKLNMFQNIQHINCVHLHDQ